MNVRVKRVIQSGVWCAGLLGIMSAPVLAGNSVKTKAAATSKPELTQEDVRTQLNGSYWELTVIPVSAGADKSKTQKDALNFDKTKVTSEFLTKAGYPGSNYSVVIGSDGIAVWETMQTKEGEGVAFWRGELSGETMQGMLSKQPLQGSAEDYAFTAKRTLQAAAQSAAPQPPTSVQPEPSPQTPSVSEQTTPGEPATSSAVEQAPVQPSPAVQPAPATTSPSQQSAQPQSSTETEDSKTKKSRKDWFGR